MLYILKTLLAVIIILTIRGIVPRYKVDTIIIISWKYILIVVTLLLYVIL